MPADQITPQPSTPTSATGRRRHLGTLLGPGILALAIVVSGLFVTLQERSPWQSNLPDAACGSAATRVPACPTPSPSSAATPPPTVSGVAIPASIDATGTIDVSGALNSWLRTISNGSTVVFPAGAVYRMSTGLVLSSRANLTLEGNGATLRSSGDGSGGSTLITVDRSTGTRIHNLVLVGNSPTPGVYSTSGEQAHGIRIYAGSATEISGVTVTAVWGDCLYVADASSGVQFHDAHCVSFGRMGVAITSGTNITVERVAFDRIGYGLFDIEPNLGTEIVTSVTFRDNTAALMNQAPGKRFFFGANGASGSSISNITVTGNTITGAPLDTYVTEARRSTIVFTNNRSLVTTTGPVLYFAHVDGLTVTGNVQPLSSGILASIVDCTGVLYE